MDVQFYPARPVGHQKGRFSQGLPLSHIWVALERGDDYI